jgi:hypothetical protein
MTKLPYREGDWIAVPLRDDTGYGVGRIARVAPGARVLVGYFFDRKFDRLPRVADVHDLRPQHAVLVRKFGDLGLVKGNWKVIGLGNEWQRAEWPIPAFGRQQPDGRAFRVEYPDDNPNAVPREVPTSTAEVSRLPQDGANGAGVIEILLTKQLAGSSAR